MKNHPNDPKDDGGKVPGFTYAWMIPYITRIARRHGYAIGVHGSMSKDLDLIAVPWVDDANEPRELVDEIANLTDGAVLIDKEKDPKGYGEKPHGRMCYTITFKRAWHYIDISVMPKKKTRK